MKKHWWLPVLILWLASCLYSLIAVSSLPLTLWGRTTTLGKAVNIAAYIGLIGGGLALAYYLIRTYLHHPK